MKVYVETYGCALNRSDEALMRESITGKGHVLVNDPGDADAIIINTCTVRLDTEYHMVKRIRELYKLSMEAGKKLIVAGCMARAQPYTVSRIAPGASLLSPQNSPRVVEVLEAPGRVVMINGVRARDRIGVYVENRVAPIPVQEGCLSNCSFCISRHARRVLVSHSIDAVVKAVGKAVRDGAVEVQLTGMDLGTYGMDLYRARRLPDLIRRIVENVRGNYMLRVGMINPEHLRHILEDLVKVVADAENVYKFLHIPLQSGSNRVLKLMRRNYTVEEYLEMVDRVKSSIPEVSIATDIIVGHPMESEEDFAETLRVVEEAGFERVHLAGYSMRPLTCSAAMPQLPTSVRKERVLKALRVVEKVGMRVRARYVGTSVRCFITEHTGTWVCRLTNYIPVVIRGGAGSTLDYGKWVEVLVEEATFFDLRGRLP